MGAVLGEKPTRVHGIEETMDATDQIIALAERYGGYAAPVVALLLGQLIPWAREYGAVLLEHRRQLTATARARQERYEADSDIARAALETHKTRDAPASDRPRRSPRVTRPSADDDTDPPATA